MQRQPDNTIKFVVAQSELYRGDCIQGCTSLISFFMYVCSLSCVSDFAKRCALHYHKPFTIISDKEDQINDHYNKKFND